MGEKAPNPYHELKRTNQQLRDLLPQFSTLIQKHGKDSQQAKETQFQIMMLLADLKRNCRNTYLNIEKQKQQVQQKKSDVEAHYLKLQNLLYEKNHLRQEIQRCKGFATKELDRVDLQGGPVVAKMDPVHHEQQLKRIAEEMDRRKQIQQDLREMKAKLKVFKSSTVAKKAFLDGLPTKLNDLEKATQPLQQYMAIPLSDRVSRQTEAQILPQPLYLAYCEFEAYIDAFGGDRLSISIVDSSTIHSSKLARMYAKKRKRESIKSITAEDANTKRTRSIPSPSPTRSPPTSAEKKGEVSDDEGQDKDVPETINFMEIAPKALLLQFSIKHGNKAVQFPVHFVYYPAIHVVGIETSTIPRVLTCLFPGDTGEQNPSLSNNYSMTMEDGTPFEFPKDTSARPYSWAQWICGIYNLAQSQQTRIEPSVEAVILQIEKRLRAHLTTSEQLSNLAKSKPLVKIHPAAKGLFDQEITTVLDSWKETEAPKSDIFAFKVHDDEAEVSQHSSYGCRYFKAVFKNDRSRLGAVIQLPLEYPTRPSRLIFQPRADSDDAQVYDNQLKNIEMEVNAYHDELTPSGSENWLLSHQIRKVQLCFDIINTSGPQTAAFGRARRGKDRRRAIVVNPENNQCRHR